MASGADFIDVAKQYDQSGLAPLAEKWILCEGEQLRRDLEEIAFGLPVGGVSVPLELEAGVYLLHVKALTKTRGAPLDAIRPQIMDAYYAARFEEEMASWFESAKSRAANTIHLDTKPIE